MARTPLRLSTPPLLMQVQESQLLTPPPTGGSKKRVRFADHDEDGPIPKRLEFSQESGPNPTSDEALQATSTGHLSISSQDDNGNATKTEKQLVPLLPILRSCMVEKSRFAKDASVEMIDIEALELSADTPVVQSFIEPFRFMDLPLKIRKMIYTLLVTVPGLICLRQNRSYSYDEPGAGIHDDKYELLPGIALVCIQRVSDGMRYPFCRFPFTNSAILRASKTTYAEAKAIMYGRNEFEISNLNSETSPIVNYKVPLLPPGYQRIIQNITLRAYAPYGFRYIVNGGHQALKNYYRGLQTLTLVLELHRLDKGYAKTFKRWTNESWDDYVNRIHQCLQIFFFESTNLNKTIPRWMYLNVLFPGEEYLDAAGHVQRTDPTTIDEIIQDHIKRGVSEAFEMFKNQRHYITLPSR